MLKTTLDQRITQRPALKELLARDVTIVMPFYERTRYFEHYLREGFWDDYRLQIVCDGSPQETLASMNEMTRDYPLVNVYQYGENKGVGFARTTGIKLVKTPYLLFCDDDDFLIEGQPFMERALSSMRDDDETLFASMRTVYAFDEALNIKPQYDRSMFDGKTGQEVLTFMVRTGEICVLSLGSVFRTENLQFIGPEDFFKVSEDYVFLARLCALYPQRRVSVCPKGGYLRLTRHDSLSSRSNYSLEKIVMHYVSMFVGAYHLEKMGGMHISAFRHILIERGRVLQTSYGKGAEAGLLMAHLLEATGPSSLNRLTLTGEQQKALRYMQRHVEDLPAEFCIMARCHEWNGI